MFQILRADAVALCEGYGLLMASGWNRDRLTKKTAEMQRLIRSEEFPDFDELDGRLQRIGRLLAEAEEFEVVQKVTEEKREVVVEEDADESVATAGDPSSDAEAEVEDEDEDVVEEKCILSTGQRVLVEEEDPWKGRVAKILSARHVEVEDRKGEVWEVAVEKCKVLKQKKTDSQDEELRQLEAKVKRAKKEKKDGRRSSKGDEKKSRRFVCGLVLKRRGSLPGSVTDDLVKEADDLCASSNLKETAAVMRGALRVLEGYLSE